MNEVLNAGIAGETHQVLFTQALTQHGIHSAHLCTGANWE